VVLLHRAWPGWAGRRDLVRVRLALVTLVTALCFSTTLRTFLPTITAETPLAYLPLLLVTAPVIVWRQAGATRVVRNPGDLELDLALGLPLVAGAAVLLTAIPAASGPFYWIDRPDVLSLALFALGCSIIVAGARQCSRLRGGLVIPLLAWPGLYERVLPRLVGWTTSLTQTSVAAAVRRLPLPVHVTDDPSVLMVRGSGGHDTPVSIGSMCSGIDGVLGLVLIGALVLSQVYGAWWRRVVWLAGAVALALCVNVARIVVIVWLAGSGHQDTAFGLVHEGAGMVLFGIEIVCMLLLLKPLGLHRRSCPSSPPRGPSSPAARGPRPPGLARRTASLGSAALVCAGVTAADVAIGGYAAFFDPSGTPRVSAFAAAPRPPGTAVRLVASYDWAQTYLGPHGGYDRFVVDVSGGRVIADVIHTDDPGLLQQYSLAACWGYHDYDIQSEVRVSLGGGVTGQALSFVLPNSSRPWVAVSWAWPVRNGGGDVERVTLLAPSDLTAARRLQVVAAAMVGVTLQGQHA
jgi:exosortase/archaeosortase family protein